MSLFGGSNLPSCSWWTERLLPRSINESNELWRERFHGLYIYIFGIGIFWKGWILKRAECIILFGMWRNKRNKAFSKFSDLAWFVDRCIYFAFFRVKFLLGAGSWRKMMEFNDGWKLKSEVFDNSLCPLDIINPLYNLFYRYYIWSIDRELKREERERERKNSTKIYEKQEKLFNFNDNNLFNSNHSSDYSVFAFQLSSLPPSHSHQFTFSWLPLLLHVLETMSQLLLIMNNHVQWIN